MDVTNTSSQTNNSSQLGSETFSHEHSDLTAESASELNTLTTIVIPTLNEQEAIDKVLDELFSSGLKNILVVDGYSSDGTVDIAKKYPIQVIFQQGKGKTGALKTAFEHVKTPFMIVMDGDFTYDASCIHQFLEKMQSYDQIIGVRNVSSKQNMSIVHRLGNMILTKTFNALMGTNLTDVCSGMYALKTETAKYMHLSSKGFDVEAEIAAQIASFGKIAEVPINYRQRIGKQKLSTWKHGSKILNAIFKFAMTYRPSLFYYIISSTTFLLGIGIGILVYTVIEWSVTKTLAVHWLLMGISILLIGMHFAGLCLEARKLRRTESRMIQ